MVAMVAMMMGAPYAVILCGGILVQWLDRRMEARS